MKPIAFLIFLISMVPIQCYPVRKLNKHQPMPQNISRMHLLSYCPTDRHDYKVRELFSFGVEFNPEERLTTKTYGLMNKIDRIYYLNIVNQNLDPNIVFCLKHLQTLHIQNTRFYECSHRLPATIECLVPSATPLNIYGTTITHLPEEIGILTHLQTLELSNSGLISLSDAIDKLSSLRFFDLSNNKLTSLPRTIANIKSLVTIILTNNPSLYSIESLNGLPSLKIIYAHGCSIKQLPRDLPQLTDLDMSQNNLTDLVEIRTLGDKTNSKKYFNFNNNQIQFIPPQIQYVNNLYWLNLEHNQLTDLPEDIYMVTTLRYLNIKNNPFENITLKKIISKFNKTHPDLKLHY